MPSAVLGARLRFSGSLVHTSNGVPTPRQGGYYTCDHMQGSVSRWRYDGVSCEFYNSKIFIHLLSVQIKSYFEIIN